MKWDKKGDGRRRGFSGGDVQTGGEGDKPVIIELEFVLAGLGRKGRYDLEFKRRYKEGA